MTLSQRAAVPLALRRAGPLGVGRSEGTINGSGLEGASAVHDGLANPPPISPAALPLGSFLACWAVRHGACLQQLSLAGCGAWVQDEHVALMADKCGATLVSLDLCGCAHLTDDGVAAVLKACRRLLKMSLAMMGQLTSEALSPLCLPPPPLLSPPDIRREKTTSTTICGCDEPDDSDDGSGGTVAWSELQALDLTGCGGIGGGGLGLERAMRGVPELRELSLRGHVSMPSENLVAALRHCAKLERLDVSCCLALDDTSVEQISRLCPHMRTLALSACPAVTMSPNTVSRGLLP
jgi:hypothetical protein